MLGVADAASPAQKAGKEVTARSGLYSLGLIAIRCYRQVQYLDPAVERAILRCFEEPLAPAFVRRLSGEKDSMANGAASRYGLSQRQNLAGFRSPDGFV
jgi:hypothetical protein